MDEKIIKIAMDIILNAGHARNSIKAATDAFGENHNDKVDSLLKEASEYLRVAHVKQTEIIQEEARGIKHEIPLLFIHAQDTLMTIMSEYNMTNNFIKLIRSANKNGGK
ncbi:MAG: PTS lactose/cellobiose transporter subunit IIA [Erysipelotrichaceae bacterium]